MFRDGMMGLYINVSCNSYLEHRASSTHRHRTLFFNATFTPFQFRPTAWPPFELIFSMCYSVVPFVLNLVDSIQEPFGSQRRDVSAMHARTNTIFSFSSSTGTLAVLLHTSWLLIVSSHLTWRTVRRHQFIKVCSCVVIYIYIYIYISYIYHIYMISFIYI
jgi:hypothetical protein